MGRGRGCERRGCRSRGRACSGVHAGSPAGARAAQKFFSAQALEGEEGEAIIVSVTWRCQPCQRRPRRVEPKLVLELLVALLGPPADLHHPHEARQAGCGRQGREPMAGRSWLVRKPFEQQPLRLLALLTVTIAMRRPYAHGSSRSRSGFPTVTTMAVGGRCSLPWLMALHLPPSGARWL